MGGDACVMGSWPSAGAAAPSVKPPANVAPLFRSSRRLKRFEPIGLSFADQPRRKSLTRSRKYTPVSGPNRASDETTSSSVRRGDHEFASWNRVGPWLRAGDELGRAASAASKAPVRPG